MFLAFSVVFLVFCIRSRYTFPLGIVAFGGFKIHSNLRGHDLPEGLKDALSRTQSTIQYIIQDSSSSISTCTFYILRISVYVWKFLYINITHTKLIQAVTYLLLRDFASSP
jgi:hypothetical protein